MQKAGNYDLPYEISQEHGDFLFSKEVNAGQAELNRSEATVRPSIVESKKTPLVMKKDFIQVAQGEDHTDNAHFDSDNSQAQINEEEGLLNAGDAEEDFAYLKHQIEASKPRDWKLEQQFSNEYVKIYRKTMVRGNWSKIVLKCIAQLDLIPKHIVLKAVSDMNLRAKWDHTIGDIDVLEHIKDRDQTYFRYRLKVPHHMQNREAVLVRKVLKDFPEVHKSAVV